MSGLPNGNGSYTCASHSYRGAWRQGLRHGLGATTYSNGDVHTGAYVDDVRHGEGVMVWTATGRVYAGQYMRGARHGTGKMTFPNGDKYVGDWNQGQRTGHGLYLFSNGNKYDKLIVSHSSRTSGENCNLRCLEYCMLFLN